jgi:transposase
MSTKIKLTSEQKQNLLKIKKLNKSEIIRDRAHAILLRNNEFTLENIAKALLRSKEFVNQAIKKFNKDELENITISNNNRKLSKDQRDEVVKIVKNETPKDLKDFKFHDQFWTVDILKIVIKKRHGIEYKREKSYYDLFKAAGFSFHKPKTKDFRQDPAKLEEFKGALKKSSTTTKIRLSW